MFNLSGSELVFLVLIALVVLGPDKLPEAMRKAGKAYADFKKMTSGFQSEMRSVLDEPMRELRETAELAKKAASWDTDMLGTKAADTKAPETKPVSARMADHTPSVTPTDSVTAAADDGEPPFAQNGSPDATTRRLHAQASADLAASTQASSAPVTAIGESGQMTGFTPAVPVPEPGPDTGTDTEAVAPPKPPSPNFTSAAPRVTPPVAAADSGDGAGAEADAADQVVAE